MEFVCACVCVCVGGCVVFALPNWSLVCIDVCMSSESECRSVCGCNYNRCVFV